MTDYVIAVALGIVALYVASALIDYRFGVRSRRLGAHKGLGWSYWADKGWKAEDRRRKGLLP